MPAIFICQSSCRVPIRCKHFKVLLKEIEEVELKIGETWLVNQCWGFIFTFTFAEVDDNICTNYMPYYIKKMDRVGVENLAIV